mgnify:CR=1 FL=1
MWTSPVLQRTNAFVAASWLQIACSFMLLYVIDSPDMEVLVKRGANVRTFLHIHI